jgi:hypothetical protein
MMRMPRSLMTLIQVFLLAGAATGAAILPKPGQPLLVVVDPLRAGPSAAEVVARAGGLLLSARSQTFAVTAFTDQALPLRLSHAGALVVLDGAGVLACGL